MAGKSNARTAADNARWADGMAAASRADFERRFGTEEQCGRYLISLKFPDGFECPRCSHGEHGKVGGGRKECRCAGCGKQFSATVGTALEGTKLPPAKWFRAVRMVSADPGGASARAIARECGVSDVAGLSMPRRIRAAMGASMAPCVVGGGWVEVDGARVACGNSDGSGVVRPGGGKADAPVLAAVSATRCALRACSDSSGSSMAEFASAHVSRGHEVRCDDHGANLALVGGWDVVARGSEAGGDSEASPPAVRRVISNFKSWLAGAFRGVSPGRLQECCGESSWRYCHRTGDAFAGLLAELVRWPHVALSRIRECRAAMPAHEPPAEPGRERNRKILARWRARERESKRPLVARLASLLAPRAGRAARTPTRPGEIPPELLALLEDAFDVVVVGDYQVSELMQDDDLAA